MHSTQTHFNGKFWDPKMKDSGRDEKMGGGD